MSAFGISQPKISSEAPLARRARSSQIRPLLHGGAPRSILQNLGKTAVLPVLTPSSQDGSLSYSSDFKELSSSSKCEKKVGGVLNKIITNLE